MLLGRLDGRVIQRRLQLRRHVDDHFHFRFDADSDLVLAEASVNSFVVELGVVDGDAFGDDLLPGRFLPMDLGSRLANVRTLSKSNK